MGGGGGRDRRPQWGGGGGKGGGGGGGGWWRGGKRRGGGRRGRRGAAPDGADLDIEDHALCWQSMNIGIMFFPPGRRPGTLRTLEEATTHLSEENNLHRVDQVNYDPNPNPNPSPSPNPNPITLTTASTRGR